MKKTILFLLITFNIVSCKKTDSDTNRIASSTSDSIIINSFIKSIGNYDYTQLGIYCKENNLSGIQKLVNAGADITLAKRDSTYIYDALYVAIENNHLQVVEYLLDNNANVNQIYTEEGLMPLSLACKLNYFDISKKLIERGANINGVILADSDYVITPLFMALQNDNYKLAKLLLDQGADVEIRNEIDKTAKDMGLGKGGEWISLFKNYKTNNEELNTEKKWKGIYYYRPYDDNDSLGNYYINIEPRNSEFGFSGTKPFTIKLHIKYKNDTMFLFDKENSALVGKLLKKNKQFYLQSSRLIDFKKAQKEPGSYFPLQFAKSSDDVE